MVLASGMPVDSAGSMVCGSAPLFHLISTVAAVAVRTPAMVPKSNAVTSSSDRTFLMLIPPLSKGYVVNGD